MISAMCRSECQSHCSAWKLTLEVAVNMPPLRPAQLTSTYARYSSLQSPLGRVNTEKESIFLPSRPYASVISDPSGECSTSSLTEGGAHGLARSRRRKRSITSSESQRRSERGQPDVPSHPRRQRYARAPNESGRWA